MAFEIRYVQVPELRWSRFRWVGGVAGQGLEKRDLFSVSKDGEVAWQVAILFPPGGAVVQSLAWAPAGLALFGGGRGVVVLALADGKDVASHALEGAFEGFATDGARVVVVSAKETLSIDRAGLIAWQAPVGGVGARFEGEAIVVRATDEREVPLDAASGRPFGGGRKVE